MQLGCLVKPAVSKPWMAGVVSDCMADDDDDDDVFDCNLDDIIKDDENRDGNLL